MTTTNNNRRLQLGSLKVEVFKGSGRRYGNRVTTVTLRCESVALADDKIMMVSAIGPESSVKALRANLAPGNATAQFEVHFAPTDEDDDDDTTADPCYDGRAEAAADDDDDSDYDFAPKSKPAKKSTGISLSRYRLEPAAEGYRCFVHKLGYGLWHVLCIAKTPGFISVMTDDALWSALQDGERFTTPLLREWLPWLRGQMEASDFKMLAPLTMVGCNAGLLTGDDADLDALVTSGISFGDLRLPDDNNNLPDADLPADLDGYMMRYGSTLGKRAERSMDPLHVPGRDPLPPMDDMLREPFAAQQHVIAATVKALRRQKAVLMVAEMGCGKTLMGAVAIHIHAAGKPYRGLIFCPGQLTEKWARELEETIPGVTVHIIDNWKDVVAIDRRRKPAGPEWYIIARDRAKLGSQWKPAFITRKRRIDVDQNHRQTVSYPACPHCGRELIDDKGNAIEVGKLTAKRLTCDFVRDEDNIARRGCGSALWQMTGDLWRYEPALYIKRRMPGFFRYLVLDEFQQVKGGADVAQANAAGSLAAAVDKVVLLSGTLVGGYAHHVRALMFRMAPASLVNEGLTWAGDMAFNERYGRIDTTITEKTGGSGGYGMDNTQSRGQKSSKTMRRTVRPGIMPSLFGRHLVDKAIFLSLSEVSDQLPSMQEEIIPVTMDAETKTEYKEIETKLKDELAQMLIRGDKRLLGKMLQTLLAYPDYPYEWGPVGYHDQRSGEYITVVIPANLDSSVIRPKEQALIDLVKSEKAAGRQVWVYVQYTSTHDVQDRIEGILRRAGFKVGSLRSSVDLAKREAWIAKHAPGLDVVVSHPKLVETGLDLFDKGGRHNFVSLVFYETGYDLFVLRQASRRSWRIGQKMPCKVFYIYYDGTMQARAMALMGKKLAAAQALEGKFSSEGLVAMGGEEGSIETALAKALVDKMDVGDVRRTWAKIGQTEAAAVTVTMPTTVAATMPAVAVTTDDSPMSGAEVIAAMKAAGVTIDDMAAALGVTKYAVTKARKKGVGGKANGKTTAADSYCQRALWSAALERASAAATVRRAGRKAAAATTAARAGGADKATKVRRPKTRSNGRKLR